MIVKQKSPSTKFEYLDLLGSVNGKDVLIVDDMIDSGDTMNRSAELLKRNGAKKIYAYATHGIFADNAVDSLKKSVISKIITSNSLTIPTEVKEAFPDGRIC